MNYIYYNEFGKEIKKYLSPIAKGSSGIKIYIFSDFDNSSETEYEVSASFKKADGFVAGDIFLPLSSNTKINPYNQQAMYYRELTIGNDVTDIVGGLQLSIRYIQTNIIVVDSEAIPPVTYEEKAIHVTGKVTFNIYDATSFISPPQNTALINLKNYLLNYIDTQDANIFEVDRTFLQSLGVTNDLTVGDTLTVGDNATFNQDATIGVDLTVYGKIFAHGGLDSRAKKIINVAPPENPLDAVNKSYVDTATFNILITKENLINKITEWSVSPTDDQYPSAKLVKDYLDVNIYTKPEIDAKLSATYKPKGTITGTELLAITPSSENEGFVYNISTEFTTTINFIEGAGITYIAGENVVIVENTEGVYKFDVLSSFVDLSGYVEKDGSKVLSDNNFTTTLKDKLDGAEITSNKVTSWSSTINDTRYPSEKLVKDSLDELNVGLENIGSLSPLRFAGYFTGGTVVNDFNNLIRPFENLTEALPDFYINNIKGAMFVCNAASDFVFNTVYTWVDGVKTTPITFTWAAPYDEGIGTINFEVGDTISILNFAYDTVENEMFILIKVEKSSGVKADKVIPASTGNIPKLNASGNLEDSGFKLEKSVPSNAVFTDTVPTVPTISTDITTDATSDITTASPKAVKSYVDNAISTVIGDIETLLEAI